jgi:predicted ATPase
MIHKIVIDNFKSLVNFEITFAKFTCLVGLNGAGKSTVLQVIDFLSQLMVGDVDNWLERRHWISADLNSKLTKKSNISFSVEFDIANEKVLWEGSFNRSSLSCTKESITDGHGKKILSVEDGYYTFDAKRHEIMFEYQGSFLSFFKGGSKIKYCMTSKN